MASDKIDIWVYAHWAGMPDPKCIGILSAHRAKGRKAFSFAYDPKWVMSKEQLLLDPDIGWFSGQQFPNKKDNFGVFLDSMPDTWGRTLMKRRAAQKAKDENKSVQTLYDIDFLLGVYDNSRMGALRFKLDPEGPFLDNSQYFPIPPWSGIKELQYSAEIIESGKETKETKKWLAVLLAPGSSLGGARPKANILDESAHPWIAKFPAKNDSIDKAAWEFLAYKLALQAGIDMTESRLQHITGNYRTFFAKRFDRQSGERIHFASAMTMTGYNEETLKDNLASYLELAEFIQYSGSNITADLHQLWKRIIFNIAISNTDDHLRNHGFLLSKSGWSLSPAFDINPSIDKDSLALNIDMNNNALDFDLATSVGEYFHLNDLQMKNLIKKTKSVVKNWKVIASELSIPKAEQKLMESAFRC